MKRTTVFADEDVLRNLRKIARRENRSFAEVTRKALTEYVSRRRPKRSSLSLVGVGRSGRKDVAPPATAISGSRCGVSKAAGGESVDPEKPMDSQRNRESKKEVGYYFRKISRQMFPASLPWTVSSDGSTTTLSPFRASPTRLFTRGSGTSFPE